MQVVLAIFGIGYGLAWWSDHDRMAAFNRCLAQSITSDGHVYCVLDSLAGGWQSAVRGQQDSGEAVQTPYFPRQFLPDCLPLVVAS